jgi:protein-disulfide isomerase/uncharacterized membrane protein
MGTTVSKEDAIAARRGRVLLIIALVLSLVGVGASVRLTVIFQQANASRSHKSACAINAQWDCDHVARSSYSRMFGAPVSLWAMLGYLLMAVFAGWGALRYGPNHWPLGVLTLLVFGALGISSYLAYVAIVILKKKCLWCTVLYFVNIAMVLTLIGAYVRRAVGPIRAVRKDVTWLLDHLGVLGKLATGGVIGCIVILVVGPQLGRPRSETRQPPKIEDLIKKPPARRVVTNPKRPVPIEPPAWVTAMVTSTTPFRGPKDADLYIVEFSDYECPFCQMSNKTMEKILHKYGKRIRLYHRHFPLDMTCYKRMKRQMHPHACFAARAAFCSHQQNKFWPFQDALFRLGAKINKATINGLASGHGLDMARFKACVSGAAAKLQIQKDLAAGESLKLEGTPTFYMGGPLIKKFSPQGLSLKMLDRLFALVDKAKGKGKAAVKTRAPAKQAPLPSMRPAPASGPPKP